MASYKEAFQIQMIQCQWSMTEKEQIDLYLTGEAQGIYTVIK